MISCPIGVTLACPVAYGEEIGLDEGVEWWWRVSTNSTNDRLVKTRERVDW